MARELIKIIENCIIGKQYPEKLRMKLLEANISFVSLFNILREYSVEESIILPERLYIDVEERETSSYTLKRNSADFSLIPIVQCANLPMCQCTALSIPHGISKLANCLISKSFTASKKRNDLHSSVQYRYLSPHSAKDLRLYGTEY